MGGSQASLVLSALIGFVIGGIVADAFARVAQVMIAGGTLGALWGAANASASGKDPTDGAAQGGGWGLLLGALVVTADALLPRLD